MVSPEARAIFANIYFENRRNVIFFGLRGQILDWISRFQAFLPTPSRTIGALRLSFRVRNGNRRFPHAMIVGIFSNAIEIKKFKTENCGKKREIDLT